MMPVVSLMIFVAIVAAYSLGRSVRPRNNDFRRPRRPADPAEVLLEYRGRTGLKSQRKARIMGYMSRDGRRPCLFAVCNNGSVAKTFAVDRIGSIASLDGQKLDTGRFLHDNLGVGV